MEGVLGRIQHAEYIKAIDWQHDETRMDVQRAMLYVQTRRRQEEDKKKIADGGSTTIYKTKHES